MHLCDVSAISDGKERLLVARRVYSKKLEMFGLWESCLKITQGERKPYDLDLNRGGCIRVYPNLLGMEEVRLIRDELISSALFRQYRIQGNDEPRCHFMLHAQATKAFECNQPGYRYGNTTMKSRPLSCLPLVEALSRRVAGICGVRNGQEVHWNIGVNPIIYRDERDKMGYHSDDDQDERIIMCIVLDSPRVPRVLRIKPRKGNQSSVPDSVRCGFSSGDEEVDIFPAAGDGYEMNGEMQRHYVHGIPRKSPDNLNIGGNDSSSARIVIIFRAGRQVGYLKDSGRACFHLAPPVVRCHRFGAINGLEEGGVYSRAKIRDGLGAHLSSQKGISGTSLLGSDAIVVSGQWPGLDSFFQLWYTATSAVGAQALSKSFEMRYQIRVFRSSIYLSYFKAIKLSRTKGAAVYRYDGLYRIISSRKVEKSGGVFLSV